MPAKASKSNAKRDNRGHGQNQKPAGAIAVPNWPTLQPLLPASDVELNSVLPGQIITASKLWTTSLCKAYVSFLSSLPLTTTPGKPRKGEAVRVNDRFQIDDPTFAESLWNSTALADLVQRSIIDSAEPLDIRAKQELWGGEVLGLSSNIRIYRYSNGQFFDQHCM